MILSPLSRLIPNLHEETRPIKTSFQKLPNTDNQILFPISFLNNRSVKTENRSGLPIK